MLLSKIIYLLHVEKYKAKKVTPTWNDESELPDSFYSVSDTRDYIDKSSYSYYH